jgi:hypothetical protein
MAVKRSNRKTRETIRLQNRTNVDGRVRDNQASTYTFLAVKSVIVAELYGSSSNGP